MYQIFGDIFRKSSKVSRGTLYFVVFAILFHVKQYAFSVRQKPQSKTATEKAAVLLVDVGCEREGYGYLKCGTAGVVPFGAFYKVVRRLRRLRAKKFLSARFSEYAPCIQRTPPSRSWLRPRRYLPCVSPLPRD